MSRSQPAVPCHCDIVITRHATDDTAPYVVGSPAEPDQLRFPTYTLAFGAATAIARRAGVEIWRTDDRLVFTRVTGSNGGRS